MIILGMLVVLVFMSVGQVEAAYGINRTINFQGKLVTAAGVNVPNSTPVTATFSVYQTNSSCPGGGTAVWSENQTFTPVDGIFQVALGSSTAFGTSIDFSQDTLYLGIQISGESSEMCMGTTRIKLAAVPYAFNAEKFAGLTADNSQTNYFTVTGGQGTTATLKVDGNITVGSVITPTSSGGLTIQSNGANTMTVDTGGAAALNIGATSNAITIGTAANSNGLTLNSGTGDITLTSTDDVSINGGGASAVINIGTTAVAQNVNIGNTSGGTITIGQTSGSDLVLQDANWGVTGAGAATLTGLNLGTGSFASCDLLRSDGSGNVTCSTNGFNVVSAQNSNNVTWVDNDTTDLWATTANLQITVSSGSEVLVLASMQSNSVDPAASTVSLGARMDREAAGSASDCTDVNTVGTTFSMNPTHQSAGTPAYVGTASVAFVDSGTSAGGTFEYEVCTDAASTVLGGTWQMDVMELTLIEVNDAGDLAEVFPTNDTSLQMAEVVSIDGSLEGGVLRSTRAYDKNLLGVVTTKPALVIGSRNGQGSDGKPVALTGRVPVRVSDVNGKIQVGDPLTSSEIPGVAMKATKSGPIIGVAMRDYLETGIGTVLAYVKTGYYTGGNLDEIVKNVSPDQQQKTILAHFVAQKPVTVSQQSLSELVADRIVAGLEVITPTVYAETIYADRIDAKEIAGLENMIASESARLIKNLPSPTVLPTPTISADTIERLLAINGLQVNGPAVFGDKTEFKKAPEFTADTGGYGVLHAGTDWVEIVFDNEYKSPPVVIIGDNYFGLKVANKTTKGFRVEYDKKAKEDIEFSWMAVAVTEPKTFRSVLPTVWPTVIPEPVDASDSGHIDDG